jgi:hypothetical protein
MRAPTTNHPLRLRGLAGWFGQSKDGGQLAENLELDRLIAPAWVNDDVLNDLADAVEGPVPAFVACLGQRPLQ